MAKRATGIAGLILAMVWTSGIPAYAEVKLNIDGTYGDEAGCKLKKAHTSETESAMYLSEDGYGGVGWHCKFVWAYEDVGLERGYSHWVAITLCHREGEAYSGLLTIEQHRDMLIVSLGPAHERTVLSRCE